MARLEYRQTRARLIALFALVGIILLCGIAWAGWRLIEQDRLLESERMRERLDSSAGLICREMVGTLAGWEQTLGAYIDGAAVTAPPGAVIATFDNSGIVRQLGAPLLYQPAASPAPATAVFSAAEILEFREGDCPKASALYRDLARTGDLAIKAGALMRLARCLRKQNRLAEALEIYAQLAGLGDKQVAGSPAALLALRERITLHQALGDGEGRDRDIALLAAALRDGTYRIDRATYEFFRECLPEEASSEERKMQGLSEAVTLTWSRWREAPEAALDKPTWQLHGGAFISLLRKAPEGSAALVSGCDDLLGSLAGSLSGLRVRIDDPQGQLIWGDPLGNDIQQVMKTSLETGLPWNVRVASADSAAERAASVSRRRLLLGAMVLIALALAAAGYAIFRAVSREVGVARLQSDFVAAVSHEFRTPLAAMCHLTESLEDNRVDEPQRPAYYRALARESRRLKEMVENLLDFARMESGRQVYRKEELDIGDLVHGVVEDFQSQASDGGRRIDLELSAQECRIRGDAEALARAVRNLIDNAMKYSPASSPVRVSVSADREQAMIAVEDQGAGIKKPEHRKIFRKFMRGSSSRSLNVKGTGIGLAMVRHIVLGHGGKIEVASEPGRGSRFTITLPRKQQI